jgi:CarD family transcriptional regulator
MFEIGDAVVHPDKGAGIIANIKRMPGLKKKRQCYKIRMVEKRPKTVLMIPIKHAQATGLRLAISESQVDRVWQALSAAPQELPKQHKNRYKLLKDKLQTGDITKVAEVIRDLRWRRMNLKKGKLNVPGQRIYKKALHLLAGELAVAQDIDLQSAKEQIDSMLDESLPEPEID